MGEPAEEVINGLDISALAKAGKMRPDQLKTAIRQSKGVRELAVECHQEGTKDSALDLIVWSKSHLMGEPPKPR